MGYLINIPQLATSIDRVYAGSFPALSPVNTVITIQEIVIPFNTIGKVELIENQSANINEFVPFLTINQKPVPDRFGRERPVYMKEDRPYIVSHPLLGSDRLLIQAYNRLAVGASAVECFVRLMWWNIEWGLVEKYQKSPDLSPFYDLKRYMEGD